MRRLETRWTAAAIGMIAMTIVLSGCPKKPQTVGKSAQLPETGAEAPPPPPLEDVTPLPPPADERPIEPAPPADPGASGLADVYFEYDRAEISPAARTVLERNAKWLMARGQTSVRVEGHADERGTNEYNLALGERRAQAVKRVLAALGVPAGRVSIISYGEEQPACRQTGEACYQQNRRAHLAVR